MTWISKLIRRLRGSRKAKKDVAEETVDIEEQERTQIRTMLCSFFERRGYEFYTRTPMVKMGTLYPDLSEFVPPTANRAWQEKLKQLYPSLSF